MAFKYYKYLEKDNVADGSTYEDKWAPTEDITIKRIHLARKDGAAFTKSTFYAKVGEDVYTYPVVPCNILGPDILTSPVLDIPVEAKADLAFTLKNLEGAAVSVMVTFECW